MPADEAQSVYTQILCYCDSKDVPEFFERHDTFQDVPSFKLSEKLPLIVVRVKMMNICSSLNHDCVTSSLDSQMLADETLYVDGQ